MKKTARQKAICKELKSLQALQDAYQGKSFLTRTPSKRQARLIREFWAIARREVTTA